MSTARKAEQRRVKALLLRSTEVLPEGFRIDLKSEVNEWSALSRALGSARLCALCAEALEQAYEQTFSEPFLFSAPCMAYELRYHLNAYLWTQKLRRTRPVSTLILKRNKIAQKCYSVEIDRTDVYRWSQRLLFRYFFGIRKGWLRSPRDPYAVERHGHWLRVPFGRPHKNQRF